MAEALGSHEGRGRALKDVDGDVYAASTRGTRDSLWTTWLYVAAVWGVPPLPVTAATVRLVAAGLKAGGYRSADAYFARARQEHLRVYGAPVEPAVAQAMTDYARSVSRGVGPSALKDSFRMESLTAVAGLPSVEEALLTPEGQAVAPVALVLLGSWWMCRGIELSAAEVSDISVDTVAGTAAWNLPVCKTDPQAKGAVRVHGCACSVPGMERICPVHFLLAYLALLRGLFGATAAVRARRLPLFPWSSGTVLSKGATVAAVRAVMTAIGEPLERTSTASRQRSRTASP